MQFILDCGQPRAKPHLQHKHKQQGNPNPNDGHTFFSHLHVSRTQNKRTGSWTEEQCFAHSF